MVKMEDLLLLGMFNPGIFNEHSIYEQGYPLCYSAEVKGGYCFVAPWDDNDCEKLPNDLILIPSLIEFLVNDLINSAASSAIYTTYSLADVPKMRKDIEKEIIAKIPSYEFFWLEEFSDYNRKKPIQNYPEGLRRVSFFDHKLSRLLGRSDKTKEMITGFNIFKERYDRGALLWSTEVDLDEREKLWESEALKGYDKLLSEYIKSQKDRTASYDSRERIRNEMGEVRAGINVFCGLSSLDEPNLRTLIGRENNQKLIERLAHFHYHGDKEVLLKDLEQFKQKLVAEHS